MTTIERIAGGGLGAFAAEFELDLRPFEGQLVCLCGENGVGKTTVLECVSGAMYRRTPSQGPIENLAGPEGGFIEVDIIADRRYRIRQNTPAGEPSSSTVCDQDGSPQTNSADVREFDRWAAKHLPDESVYHTTEFAAQGAASFAKVRRIIDEHASRRKDILLSALGVSYLEELAVLARVHAAQAGEQLAAAKARLAESRRGAVDTQPIEARVETLRQAVRTAREHSDESEQDLRDAEKRLRESLLRDATAGAAAARASDLRDRIAQTGAQLEHATRKQTEAMAVLARGPELSVTARTLTQLQSLLNTQRLARTQAATVAAAKRAEANSEKELERAALARAQAPGAGRELGALREQLRAASEAASRLPEMTERQAQITQHVRALESQVEQLQSMTMHGAFDRIEGLAARLEHIAAWHVLESNWNGSIDRVESYAEGGLAEDRSFSLNSRSAPQETAQQLAALSRRRMEAEDAARARQETELLAARVQDLQKAVEHAEASLQRAAQAGAEAATHGAAAAAATAEAARMDERGAALKSGCSRLERRIPELESLVAAVNLDKANAEASHFGELCAGLQAQLATLQNDLGAMGQSAEEPVPDSTQVDVEESRSAAAQDAEALRQAEAELAVAKADLERAHGAAARSKELARKDAYWAQESSDWTRLGRDLGRGGVQALEIDSTGPELAVRANDLLHSCHGSRFTTSIKTSRAAAGKRQGQVEGFFIHVMDTKRGRQGLIESYSGGERVLLGEAVSLGLTVIAAKRSRSVRPTLIRDESGAALDQDSARAYVAMLRRAAKQIGAHCVLLVSHSPAVQQLSDVRVVIQDGRLAIT